MRVLALALLAVILAACGASPPPAPPSATAALPSGRIKIGKPYKIDGRWYYPSHDPDYDTVGVASWYGADFHGLKTANGEIFDMHSISAAHTTLPLPSLARVTNLENGRQIVLRVNDRGPFIDDRVIDLSQAAARELGFERKGLAKVRVQFLGFADDSTLVATPVRLPAARPGPAAPRETQVADASDTPPVAARPAAVVPASAPAAPPPAIGVPSDCTAGWVVQVGAFADADRLRATAREVAHLHTVHVEPAFVGDVPVARLRLGPLPLRSEASDLLRQVRQGGHAAAFAACATLKPGARVS